MAAAATPYIAWLNTSAAQAEQAAVQAKAAAGAYEAAFVATVPPPVIAANRALLASLVATNILGQNTPAIAATEAQYAEMWAQDAAAMYGYAGSSAAATQLTPFTAAPTTTNSSGETNQSAAVASATQSSAGSGAETALSQAVSQAPAAAQSSTTTAAAASSTGTSLGLSDVTGALTSFNNIVNTAAGPYTPLGLATGAKSFINLALNIGGQTRSVASIGGSLHPAGRLGLLAPLLHSDLLTGSTAFQSTGGGTVLASAGRAGAIGSLSVPANWASAVPAVRTVASELPETTLDAAPAMIANAEQGMFGPTALSSLAGRAVGGTATRAMAGTAVRVPGAVATDDIATTSTVIVIPPNAK